LKDVAVVVWGECNQWVLLRHEAAADVTQGCFSGRALGCVTEDSLTVDMYYESLDAVSKCY
jgi:hypothetical protein